MHVFCLLAQATRQARPDCITFSASISVLEKALRWKKASEVYAGLWNRGVKPAGVTFNAAASVLVKARRWQQAMLLLTTMEVNTVSADSIFFGVLLKSSAFTALTPVGKTWAQMQKRRVAPDAVACGSALEGFVLERKASDSASTLPRLQDLGIAVLRAAQLPQGTRRNSV